MLDSCNIYDFIPDIKSHGALNMAGGTSVTDEIR